jgi:hypothetical protein
MSNPNSMTIHVEEWRDFKDWLIGQGFKEEKTIAFYEKCRMRCSSGDDPILVSWNTKNDHLKVYGGRGVDLWYRFIQE